jgi:anti-sigma factor RsiW
MTGHLGAAVNAFVDGELDHVRRDEVLTHLAWCSSCRVEVESLRRFKDTLRAAAPAVPMDLSARLMAVSTFPTAEIPTHPRRRPLHGHPRLRRTAVSGAFVVLGIGGAISLAGPPPRQPVAPVDPTNAGFVSDHWTTTREVPLTEVNVVPAAARTSQPSP